MKLKLIYLFVTTVLLMNNAKAVILYDSINKVKAVIIPSDSLSQKSVDSTWIEFASGTLSQQKIQMRLQMFSNNKTYYHRIKIAEAFVNIEKYQNEKAILILNRVVAEIDDDEYLRLIKIGRAKIFVQSNQYDSAIAIYGELISKNSEETFDIYNNLGYSLYQVSRSLDGQRYFLRSIELLKKEVSGTKNNFTLKCNLVTVYANLLLTSTEDTENSLRKLYVSAADLKCDSATIGYLYFVASKITTDPANVEASLLEGLDIAIAIKSPLLINIFLNEIVSNKLIRSRKKVFELVKDIPKSTISISLERSISEFMISYYFETGNIDSAKMFVEKYKEQSEKMIETNKLAGINIYNIEMEKWSKKIEYIIDAKKSKNRNRIYIIAVTGVLIVFALYLYWRQYRRIKKT